MFKVFKAFVKKEMYHILRDKRTLIILFVMPVAQVLIFGYAVTNDFRDAKIDVLDYAKNETSLQLVKHIQSSGNFLLNKSIHTEKEIESGFRAGNSNLVLVIPKNFAVNLYGAEPLSVQLLVDGSDPNNAKTLVQYMTVMIQDFQKERLMVTENPFQVGVEIRMLYNPQLISAFNFVPGTIALILLIVSTMLTSMTISREKEQGTMEILLVSPLPHLLIILGKVVPYALLSFINAILVLLLGYFVFDVPIVGSLILLLLICMLYVITSLSLGILISTISKTQQEAILFSLIGLLMPVMILSGFMFPLASMPVVLQYLGQINPATYFIEILKGIMLRGVGLNFIILEVSVLLAMTLFFLFIAYKKFKIRLE